MTVLFALMYKLLPAARIAWSDVWLGAAATSLLFWIGKFAIGSTSARATSSPSFGAAGTLVLVILWVYLLGADLLSSAPSSRTNSPRRTARDSEGRASRRRIPASADGIARPPGAQDRGGARSARREAPRELRC
jgi:hypothetical protein